MGACCSAVKEPDLPAERKETGRAPETKEALDGQEAFDKGLQIIREEERPLLDLTRLTHFDLQTLRKLHGIFQEISDSEVSDGVIDHNELTKSMGLNSNSLLAKTIFKLFDTTQTKEINFRTWTIALSALSGAASLEEKIKFSFSLYDLNDDGVIDIKELKDLLVAALRETDVDLSKEQVDQICDVTLSTVDVNGDGKVQLQEYRQVVQASPKFREAFTLDIDRLCNMYLNLHRRLHGAALSAEEAQRRADMFRQKAGDATLAAEPEAGGLAVDQAAGTGTGTGTTATTTTTTTTTTAAATTTTTSTAAAMRPPPPPLNRMNSDPRIHEGQAQPVTNLDDLILEE